MECTDEAGLTFQYIKGDNVSKLNSSILVSDGITEHFAYDKRMRQGSMISTSLLVLFLNEIHYMLQHECQEIYVSEIMPNLISLFYADDISNVSDSVGRLQMQLNILPKYCKLYGMKVNIEKTKVIFLEEVVC